MSPRWDDSALRAQYLPPRGRWPGVWQSAANQNHNDCRWQSFLNYTPGRKRNGDILRAECRKSKMVQCRNPYDFNQLPPGFLNISPFLFSHKKWFRSAISCASFPPGEAILRRIAALGGRRPPPLSKPCKQQFIFLGGNTSIGCRGYGSPVVFIFFSWSGGRSTASERTAYCLTRT